MIKKLTEKKKKKEIKKESDFDSKPLKTVSRDEDEIRLDTDITDFSDTVNITKDATEESSVLDKDLSFQMKVGETIDQLEDSILDVKNFSISDATRKDAEETTHNLAELLKAETSFLKENEFVLERINKTIGHLEDVVGKNKITKDFDASILELKTIIGQAHLEKIQHLEDDNVEVIDLSSADTSEFSTIESSPKVQVEKYIDNRDHSKNKNTKSTGVVSAEELDFLQESGAISPEVELKTFKPSQETREYLEQSNRIKEALKEKSTHLISGQLRFLSQEERAKKENEEFMSKFLANIRRPSIYEMSIQELQVFATEKGLKNFDGMSRDELLAFLENPLRLYGEKFITQNPYIEKLKIELADNATLRQDVTLSEAKVVESLKAAKAYTKSARASTVTWQALFIISLIVVIAATIGVLVYFLAFAGTV